MSMVAAYHDDGPELPKCGSARAAILLIALGAPGAERVLKHLSPDEIRRLNESAASLEAIESEQIDELVDAFQDAFKKAPGLDGPARQMTELLQSALSEEEFASIFMSGDDGSSGDWSEQSGRSIWDAVANMEGNILAPKLAKEHPQVVALLLSKVPADTASIIVREFQPAFRNDVMRRMLSLKQLSDPVVALFERHVRHAYLGASDSPSKAGTHAILADIVNRLEKSQSDELIDTIRAVQPREAETLLKLLFAFEDLPNLPQKSRLTLFDAVPTEVVILALRGTEGELREASLAALGARARRMVESELAQVVDVQASEIEGARRRIANEALRLSGEGKIQLRAPEETT
ncbi:MAG TPA: FliG C-terminal domain-containing protein [Aurantimonas sp.]|uniref:Flagellar motor switch protein FliG n=1 Tax=Aurantimonas marianensis TaxID=2920428 RepID=A0A9X2KFM8_9HYPH|nr:FliG C-terminal domain-containing protein [Aurantimonas marianensis]MCP3055959.1 flagellar motor switch protein FliG [Aurantimonas marianensis]